MCNFPLHYVFPLITFQHDSLPLFPLRCRTLLHIANSTILTRTHHRPYITNPFSYPSISHIYDISRFLSLCLFLNIGQTHVAGLTGLQHTPIQYIRLANDTSILHRLHTIRHSLQHQLYVFGLRLQKGHSASRFTGIDIHFSLF